MDEIRDMKKSFFNMLFKKWIKASLEYLGKNLKGGSKGKFINCSSLAMADLLLPEAGFNQELCNPT